MIEIACRVKPDQVTLVPEKREERTTEGGLDLRQPGSLRPFGLRPGTRRQVLVAATVQRERDGSPVDLEEVLRDVGPVVAHADALLALLGPPRVVAAGRAVGVGREPVVAPLVDDGADVEQAAGR